MSNETTALQAVQLVQLPILKNQISDYAAKFEAEVAALNLESRVACDDTIKSLKATRAEYNRRKKEQDDAIKSVLDPVMIPINEVKEEYKTKLAVIFARVDDTLKTKIQAFEMRVKDEKKAELVEYFNELTALNRIDFLKFEHLKIDVNISTTSKAYKEQINTFVQRVADDIMLIDSLDFAAEAMAEYKANGFNASGAITTIKARKEAEKLEADRIQVARTEKRETHIRGMNFVWKDLTKCFHYISNENIFLTKSEIKTLGTDEFRKLIVEIEAKIKGMQIQSSPATTLFAPPVEVKAEPKAEPAQSFDVTFEVNATLDNLKALKNFMESNGIKYKTL